MVRAERQRNCAGTWRRRGATIVTLRGDGAGIHTLDSAHDKAYTAYPLKTTPSPRLSRLRTWHFSRSSSHTGRLPGVTGTGR